MYRVLNNCPSLVNYNKAGTGHLIDSDVMLSHVAEWYAIMDVLDRQLDIIATSDDDQATLEGMRALVLGLKQSYFNVLQDLHCNCTDDCKITTYETIDDSLCPYPLHKILYDLEWIGGAIGKAKETADQFSTSCGCDSATDTKQVEWFKAVFPPTLIDYAIMIEELTP